MNGTNVRRAELRNLAQRMARARSAISEQTVEREAAIRRDGVAHPKSIQVSRRLSRTQGAYRSLLARYRTRAHEDARSTHAARRQS